MPIDILSLFLGSKQVRDLKSLAPLVRRINALEPEMHGPAHLRLPGAHRGPAAAPGRRRQGLDELLPEAFALVREAARRALGERIYDVQLMGGIVLHQGRIMEMKTGEGKTLSSVTAAYLNCLTGAGVHVVTVNDYLAERDAEWMGRIYRLLGVSVGVVLSQLDNEGRKAAYARDITYGTNNEFGFDYLRDNMRWEASGKVQRGHNFCIIDEIDSILIDEARTPLIISGRGGGRHPEVLRGQQAGGEPRGVRQGPGHRRVPGRGPGLPDGKGRGHRRLQDRREEQAGILHRPRLQPHRGAGPAAGPGPRLAVRVGELRVHPLLPPRPCAPSACSTRTWTTW